jgi:hypothetical protein
MLPWGAIAKSRGLSSGSLTSRVDCISLFGANAVIVLSPSPIGPTPEPRKNVSSLPKANPRGNGTIPGAGGSRVRGNAATVRALRSGGDARFGSLLCLASLARRRHDVLGAAGGGEHAVLDGRRI